LFFVTANHLYHSFHPNRSHSDEIIGLILVPTFLAGVSLGGLLLANVFLWHIPPIRGILDANARGVRGGSFRDAMKTAWQALLFMAFPSILLAFVLAYSPWDK
jgi:hypothetical protein